MGDFTLYLSILWLLWVGNAEGAVIFEDGFEDGDFTNNPTWTGDTSDFIVIENDNGRLLQLNGDSENGGVSYLSTPSTNVVGSWEFYIRLDFAPSNGNKADVFLMSDRADLTGSVNGYALRAGESGSNDVFHIVRYENGTETATVLSGTTDISSGGEFRVRVSRDSGGSWSLEVGEGYDGYLSSEGSPQVDNTHTTAAYFGVRTTYTSTRADKFFFDFRIDLPPFEVETVTTDDDHIDLRFNRLYDASSVEKSDFFLDNGFGVPSSLTLPDPQTVRLYYNTPFPSGAYKLTINDILDNEGREIDPNHTATFYIFDSATPGDVIINEFVYDPPTGSAEYVELKNISDKFLNLQNWQIGDDSKLVTISGDTAIFPPGDFRVISKDTTALNILFGSRDYVEAGLPALNNTGDMIRLFNGSAKALDSLQYKPEWGGEDVALERRSATALSTYKENWSDSPNHLGGTPGRENEVEDDKNPPEWVELNTRNASTLELIFSEPINPQSAQNPNNFLVNPTRTIQSISTDSNVILLQLAEPMVSGTNYEITVSGLTDIFGNQITSSVKNIDFIIYETAQRGDVVINEFNYSTSSEFPEFIELYNSSNKIFNLQDWSIGDETDQSTINTTKQLKPDQYLVLTGDESFAHTAIGDGAIYLSDFPTLNNRGDAIFLQSDENITVDSLHYSSSWGGKYSSLERKDPEAASGDPSNWTSESEKDHSAGTVNETYEPDSEPPKAVFAKQLKDQSIEIQFNEFVIPVSKSRYETAKHSYTVASFDSLGSNRLLLEPVPSKTKKSDNTLIISNLNDVKGNTAERLEVEIAQPVQTGYLAINEIMYQPLDDPNDNLPNQSEYIELKNTRDFPISLEGLFLHDAPNEDGIYNQLEPVDSRAKWIPAKGYALIYADKSSTFKESKTAEFFELNPNDEHSIMRIDRTSLSLTASDDAIYISDSSGTAIDSVFYDETWHNPNLIDTRGIALERIRPDGPGNESSNWGSSVEKNGGTPHKQNSIYQEIEQPDLESGIQLSPNPFSPDNDGYEDHLFIHYRFDEPDYLLKVHIYDRYGRLVRRLADGVRAGFEGKLIWDGLKDDKRKNRIGIYIVVVEAYGSASGRPQAFKKSVVLARRLH